MKKILNTFGFNEWNVQGLGKYLSERRLSKALKLKLENVYESNWATAIQSNDGKLRTYKLFKKDFCLENYLLCSNFNDRKYVSKLRTSSHKLGIETGRHIRPVIPKDQRFCPSCDDRSIDDEHHFMLNCKQHSSERESLFKSLDFSNIDSLDDSELFIFLMSYNKGDTEIAKIIINYVKSTYQSRFSC